MTDRSANPNPFTPHIHVLTLGVADLERAVSFYRDGLGLRTEGITGTQYLGSEDTPAGAVAMFTLDDGLILSLYPSSDLAKDAGIDAASRAGSNMSIGHLVDSREDVDRVLDLAAQAGARIHEAAHERPWGIYSGYFSDPDDHMWEIIYFHKRQSPGSTAS
jgi:catechol 2,3-dioxygenase-like lactoylglutathione lyase family enzyme